MWKKLRWVVAGAVVGSLALLAETPSAGLHQYNALTLTPSGDRIATVDTVEPFADSPGEPPQMIVIRSSKDGTVLASLNPHPGDRYGGLAWSPNGRQLAFVATDRKTGTSFLEALVDGKPRVLWSLHGSLQNPRWSPDGRNVAVLAVENAHKQVGAREPGADLVGEIGTQLSTDEQRIAVVPSTGLNGHMVSPADHWVYEYDWTPDGKGFVATSARGDGDNNWWVARLVAVDADTGGMRELAAPKMQMNFPRVSADGRTVAFIGGLMSDLGLVGGDVYTVPIGGGEPVDLTPGYKGTFTSLLWRGNQLLGTILQQERTSVFQLEPSTGALQIVDSQPTSLSAGDAQIALSQDGQLASTVSQSFDSAPEILSGPLNAMKPVTSENARLQPLVSARNVVWRNQGFDVQGWLLSPLKLQGHNQHPMLVVAHGGPAGAVTPRFVSAHQSLIPLTQLLAQGYFIFMPNPRGSFGQGESFTAANRRDFGGGDLRDILAGVDAVEKMAPIDDRRLAIFGHSYGGFMAMWAVTHTDRFKAAIAGAGISNWISYYGENGINEWMPPFFGASAYDDPAIYQQSSPLSFIKKAHTPCLIYVGERDVECPAAQSLEFWRALQAMGVPSQLMIYAGQGHRISAPSALEDLRRRELEWLGKYLKP